ncbi:predicted protein [Chaetomium globosum CBS 148.51]|uniref:Uncharacterized protein n=1 Tax=Chaetomium globosum (strain ATCC 6205 / CBS 148.51 / DSM 1962 / NBRC 6347 / NRRL 1970) TaxID=306901 RepID=Q2H7K9_CHAGB|nr:uncharacterized protein CHGG_05356 [Chaetomium globosum CBS 148.51]EAQ88737.1 predicted protein [Chaetomium globosum CBS 148.51]
MRCLELGQYEQGKGLREDLCPSLIGRHTASAQHKLPARAQLPAPRCHPLGSRFSTLPWA